MIRTDLVVADVHSIIAFCEPFLTVAVRLSSFDMGAKDKPSAPKSLPPNREFQRIYHRNSDVV